MAISSSSFSSSFSRVFAAEMSRRAREMLEEEVSYLLDRTFPSAGDKLKAKERVAALTDDQVWEVLWKIAA